MKVSKIDQRKLKLLLFKRKIYFWLALKISSLPEYLYSKKDQCHKEYMDILLKYK